MAADIFNPTATYLGLEVNPESTSSDNVNAANTWWAGMIRPTVSKNVTSLQFVHWSHVGTFQSLTVAIYTDNSGQPGTLLQSSTVTPAADFTWESVTITSQAVVAGTAYWVVIHGSTLSGSNSIEMRRLNDPDGLVSGTANRFSVSISTDGGSSWNNQGSSWMGCVGFGYADSTFEGCGYGDFDQTDVKTSSDNWGEYFNPATSFTASKVGFKVKKSGAGTPSSDLLWFVQNVDSSTTLDSGTLVLAANVTTSFAWYDGSFSSNINFAAGTNYRVYLKENTTGATTYQINRPKTVNNGNSNAMTFGGTVYVATEVTGNSQDSSRDVPFRLTLVAASGKRPSLLSLMGVG